MSEELLVVLNRSENAGFGFSLLGKPGLPPIIYNILDDSPAAESGEVEVGDVILKVNETDVNRFSTKEGKGRAGADHPLVWIIFFFNFVFFSPRH
jgi:PH/SEC7 domain-containing protein